MVGTFGQKLLDFFTAPLDGKTEARKELAKQSALEGTGRTVSESGLDTGPVEAARLSRLRAATHRKASAPWIPPPERVLVKAVVEALFTDAGMVSEYLGGVLAGAGMNEDATAQVALIGRLSDFQLRLHYVCYRALWQLEAVGQDFLDLRDLPALTRSRGLFIPRDQLLDALGLTSGPEVASRLNSALHVLAREDLIARSLNLYVNLEGVAGFGFDSGMNLTPRSGRQIPGDGGLVAAPTPAGIELFLWGCGRSDHDPAELRRLTNDAVTTEPLVPSCEAQLLTSLEPVSG